MMGNSLYYSNQRLFKVLFAFTTIYLAISPLNVSALNYLLRIPSLIIIVSLIWQTYRFERYKCVLAILVLVLVFLVHLLVDTDITIDIILSIFSVLAFLMIVIVSDEFSLNDSSLRFANTCSLFSAIVLVVYYYSPLAFYSSAHGIPRYGPYLTFGFDNSNYAGIVAFLIFSMLFVTMGFVGKFRKILCVLMEVVLGYFIYLTNTRTALAAAIIIPVLYILFRKIRFPNLFILLVCCIPFIFVPFYISLGASGDAEGQVIMGKSIMSGRDEVYMEYIESLSNPYYWLIGNLQENKLQNAHNGPLAILTSCGILGVLSYFYIFISKLLRANKSARSFQNEIAIFVLLATIINTTGEAALLLGGFPAVTYLFTFFIISQTRVQNKGNRPTDTKQALPRSAA